MKISSFLVMIAVIGLFVGVFLTFYADMGDNYGASYNDTTLTSFDRLDELKNTSRDINTSITQVTQGNPIDVIGGLLQSGYTVLKNTWSGFSIFTSITEEGLSAANLGNAETHFRSALWIISFLLFIFAIIAVLTGRNNI